MIQAAFFGSWFHLCTWKFWAFKTVVPNLFGTRSHLPGRVWRVWGWFRMIQTHYMYCGLNFCYYYYISSILGNQALDPRGWAFPKRLPRISVVFSSLYYLIDIYKFSMKSTPLRGWILGIYWKSRETLLVPTPWRLSLCSGESRF